MKLTLAERFAALKLLPAEANFVTLKVVRDLQETLAPTEKEIKDWDIKVMQTTEGVRTTWSEEAKKIEVEIKTGEKATDIFVEALEKLEKDKKLTVDMITLYEKFIKK